MESNSNRAISSFSIILIFAFFAFIGLFLINSLSIQLYPNNLSKNITIETNLTNSSTINTEKEITNNIESVISKLEGIESIVSITKNDRSTITINLDKWTVPETFRFRLSSEIRHLKQVLPSNSSFPLISTQANVKDYDRPFLILSILKNHDVDSTYKLIEDKIRPLLEGIDGIKTLEVSKIENNPIGIFVNSDVIPKLIPNLTMLYNQLKGSINGYDIGLANTENGHISLKQNRSVFSIEQLENYPIILSNERLTKLSKIAKISDYHREKVNSKRINGKEYVGISFYSKNNSNIIHLVKRIKDKLKLNVLKDNQTLILTQYDQSKIISSEINKVTYRTIISISILLLLIFIVFRNVKQLLLIILCLTINILISCVFFYIFNVEIHIYTLAGVTISLGLIIDNVVLIIDEYNYLNTTKIINAIAASTFIVIFSISIIFFLEDSYKNILIDFSISIIIILCVSLFVCFYFIPAFLKIYPISDNKSNVQLYEIGVLKTKFGNLYKNIIAKVLPHRKIIFIIIVFVFGLPIFLLPDKLENTNNFNKIYNNSFGSNFYNNTLRSKLNSLMGGVLYYYIRNSSNNYLKKQTNNQTSKLLISIKLPVNIKFDSMDLICREFEDFINRYDQIIEVFYTNINSATDASIEIKFIGSSKKNDVLSFKEIIEQKAEEWGVAEITVTGYGIAFTNSKKEEFYDSAFQLTGYSYPELKQIAESIKDSLSSIKRVENILISSNIEQSKVYESENFLQFANGDMSNIYNLPFYDISNKLINRRQSIELESINNLKRQSDAPVILIINPSNQNTWDLMNYPTKINDSVSFNLSSIANIEKINSTDEIVRINQEYNLYINYRFIGNIELNDIIAKRFVKNINKSLPTGFKIKQADFQLKISNSKVFLWLVIIEILIIFIICCIILESVFYSFAIILTIPISFIGVFLTFSLFDIEFDEGSYVSLLLLCGIVSNIGLYVIYDGKDNTIINLRRISFTIEKFVISFINKFKPILITNIATILSLIPFIIIGDEIGFWFSFSMGIVGGIIFSLATSIFILPLLLIQKSK